MNFRFTLSKYNLFSFLILLILIPEFSFAQQVQVTVPTSFLQASATQTNVQTNMTLASSTVTYSRKYPTPKMFTFIKVRDANFEMFPKQIDPAKYFNASSTASSTILAISRRWQTACLYNASGTVATVNGYKMCFQSGTGKPIKQKFRGELTNLETPLGLFQIQSKKDKDYKSRSYTSDGKEIEKIMKEKNITDIKEILEAAPMPYAMHIGLVFSLENNKVKGFAFTDGTAIHEKQTHTTSGAWAYPSHGCIALPKNYGKYLQSVMQIGDLVMIFDEKFPQSLQESVDTGLMSRVK